MLNYHTCRSDRDVLQYASLYTLYRIRVPVINVTSTVGIPALRSVVTIIVLLVDPLQRSASIFHRVIVSSSASSSIHSSIHPSTLGGRRQVRVHSKAICAAPDGWHRSLSPANDTKVRVHIEGHLRSTWQWHLARPTQTANVHLQAEPHGVVHCQNGRHPPCFLPSAGIYFHF